MSGGDARASSFIMTSNNFNKTNSHKKRIISMSPGPYESKLT